MIISIIEILISSRARGYFATLKRQAEAEAQWLKHAMRRMSNITRERARVITHVMEMHGCSFCARSGYSYLFHLSSCAAGTPRFGMLKLFLLYLVAFVAASHYHEIKSAQEILVKPYSLLYFYSHDCKYCNAFDPDFEYVASLYGGNDNLQIVKVNGREQRQLANTFGVKSFPSLRFYDTALKSVVSFNGQRLVAALQDFIEDNSDALPDKEKLTMSIDVVKTAEEVENANGPVLVAFASKMSDDWKKYYYPNHFYQQLAREFPHVRCKIVFFEHDPAELMQKYHVSNIPSLVYVDGDKIKVYNTFSTNQMVNFAIPEERLREFIESAGVEEQGKSFSSLENLKEHVMALEYEGHKQWRGGMNVVPKGNGEILPIEDEYERLLEGIRL